MSNSSKQGYSKWSTSGGKTTEDKIFLLSYAQAKKYFDVKTGSTSGANNNVKARITPTAYAIAQGVRTYSGLNTADGSPAGGWWLRSPGGIQRSAAIVDYDGTLSAYDFINAAPLCVRPALWIDLTSSIF